MAATLPYLQGCNTDLKLIRKNGVIFQEKERVINSHWYLGVG